MSKSIFRVVLSVAAIVAAIPSLGLSLVALAAVEVGIALVSTLLLGPSAPKGSLTNTAQGRLYATLVTTEPRKIMFGNTAGGNDVRYEAV